VRVFDAMARSGTAPAIAASKVGLKFDRAPLFMRMLACRRGDRQRVFEDLRVLELETLEVYSEQRRARVSALGRLVAAVALDAAEFVQGAEKAKFTAASWPTDVDKQMRASSRA
jgi:hypothetical protein